MSQCDPGVCRRGQFQPRYIEVVETTQIVTPPPIGEINAVSGRAAFDAVVAAIEAAKQGKVAGIVTAPINKEAMACAGVPYPGHTEILAEHGGGRRVAMMLANDEIRTVLVDDPHVVAERDQQADFEAQMSAIRLAHEGGKALGFPSPRVAVAGLNPMQVKGASSGMKRSG